MTIDAGYQSLKVGVWAIRRCLDLGVAEGVPGYVPREWQGRILFTEREFLESCLRRIERELDGRERAAEILRSDATIGEKFDRLARLKSERTGHSSRLADHYADPSYRAIVSLGKDVIPVLLREMRDSPGWWGQALKEITGADPEPTPSRPAPGIVGLSLRDIASSWTAWGRTNGYDI